MRRGAGWWTFVASCSVLVAGCTAPTSPDEAAAPGSDDSPVETDATETSPSHDGQAISARPLERWGTGRALTAHRHDPTGRLVVVTTVGLALLDDSAGEPRFVEPFGDRAPTAVALAPDGRAVAVASSAGEVVVINADDPRSVVELTPPGGTVHQLAWRPNGDLVVGTDARILVVRGGGTESETLVDAGAGRRFGPPTFDHANASFVVPAAGPDGTGYLVWDDASATSTELEPPEPGVRLFGATISGDGTRFAVARSLPDDPFGVEISTGETAVGTLEQRTATGSTADPGGTWAALGPDRLVVGTAQGFDIVPFTGGDGIVSLETAPVTTVVAGDDRFVTLHADASLQLWDLTGQRIAILSESAGRTADLRLSADEAHVSTVDLDGRIQSWSTRDGSPATEIDRFADGEVRDVSITGDSHTIAAGTSSGLLRLIDPHLDTDAGTELARLGQNVDAVSLSPTDGIVATGISEHLGDTRFDDTVTLWDRFDGSARHVFGGEGEPVPGCSSFRNRVQFAPDGRLLAANSHDFVVSVWNVADGTLDHELPPHAGSIHDLAFSPDGALLATSSDGSELRIWSVTDRRVVHQWVTSPGGYLALAFLPDGNTLAVSDIAGTISLVDVSDGTVRTTFEGAKSRAGDIAVSGDGALLAAGDEAGAVLLWSVETGQLVAELAGHTGPVGAVAFSADGHVLVSGSHDATIRTWAIESR